MHEYEKMLKKGFTRKFADYYTGLMEAEKSNIYYDKEYVEWAHEKGFLAENAYAYGLNEFNYHYYLSDYDYYRIWPLNNWSRIWINDKLTLKLMLSDTEFSNLMPKYYFYVSENGLRSLLDCPPNYKDNSVDSFINMLKEVGTFACKPNNGSGALGFFKLSYIDGEFYAGNEKICREKIATIIEECKNYVFTEYILPSEDLSKITPIIHTLRLVTINENGNKPIIVGGFLRFPSYNSGDANYIELGKNDDRSFNIYADIDVETGAFGYAKKIYINKAERISVHPDSKNKIEGSIENYEELKKLILGVAERFNTVEYMGFDIGITDKGFKCMEINSHPGIKSMQIFKPLLKNEITRNYFTSKLLKMDNMTSETIRARNNIQR